MESYKDTYGIISTAIMSIGYWQADCFWAAIQGARNFSKQEVGLLFGVQVKNKWG